METIKQITDWWFNSETYNGAWISFSIAIFGLIVGYICQCIFFFEEDMKWDDKVLQFMQTFTVSVIVGFAIYFLFWIFLIVIPFLIVGALVFGMGEIAGKLAKKHRNKKSKLKEDAMEMLARMASEDTKFREDFQKKMGQSWEEFERANLL